jgi:DNA-directed RNA polymerase specialized sigma24 family protein
VRSVSSDELASYLPRVESLAKRFAGLSGSEFDDLVQEGWLKVLLLLMEDEPVSNTAIKNAMRDWLRKCERWKRGGPLPFNDVAASETGIDLERNGSTAVYWFNDDSTPMVAKPGIPVLVDG